MVVRYWDTYPDGVIATCDTEEEAEKICNKYRRNRKPMYDYLVRKVVNNAREELRNNYGNNICELCHREYYTSRALPESLCEGQFCEEAEDSLAEENNIELED